MKLNSKVIKVVAISVASVVCLTAGFFVYKKISKPQIALYLSEKGVTVSEVGRDLAKLKNSDITDEIKLVEIAVKEGYISQEELKDDVSNVELSKIITSYLSLERPSKVAPFTDIAKLTRTQRENITAVFNARIMFGDTIGKTLVYKFRPTDYTTKEEWGLIYSRVSRYIQNPETLKSEIEKEYVGFDLKSEEEVQKLVENAEKEKQQQDKAVQLADKPSTKAEDYAKPGEKVVNNQIVVSDDYWKNKDKDKTPTLPENSIGVAEEPKIKQTEQQVYDTIKDLWNSTGSSTKTSDLTDAQAAQILGVSTSDLSNLLNTQNSLVDILGDSKENKIYYTKVKDNVSLLTPFGVTTVTYDEVDGSYALTVKAIVTGDTAKDKKLYDISFRETFIVGKQFGLTEDQCKEIYVLALKAYFEGANITKDYVVNGKTYKLVSDPFGVILIIK